jgi:hypothetical protein
MREKFTDRDPDNNSVPRLSCPALFSFELKVDQLGSYMWPWPTVVVRNLNLQSTGSQTGKSLSSHLKESPELVMSPL